MGLIRGLIAAAMAEAPRKGGHAPASAYSASHTVKVLRDPDTDRSVVVLPDGSVTKEVDSDEIHIIVTLEGTEKDTLTMRFQVQVP